MAMEIVKKNWGAVVAGVTVVAAGLVVSSYKTAVDNLEKEKKATQDALREGEEKLQRALNNCSSQKQALEEKAAALKVHMDTAVQSLRAMEYEAIPENVLQVDRRVTGEEGATMKTDGVIGYIKPGEVYKVTATGLELVPDEKRTEDKALVLPEPNLVQQLVIDNGFRDSGVSGGEAKANILGGNSLFITKDPAYIIPRAVHCTLGEAAADFAYYGCHLVPVGSSLMFNTPQQIPLTEMTVGHRYVENYLLRQDRGGGFYFEYHDCPHYHQPLNADASGWLLLGKFTPDKKYIRMSAFKIPHGYGVYMPPNVLHCDAFLKGRYLVAYTAAKHFKTGLFRYPDPVTNELRATHMRVWCDQTRHMWNLNTDEDGKQEQKEFFQLPDAPTNGGNPPAVKEAETKVLHELKFTVKNLVLDTSASRTVSPEMTIRQMQPWLVEQFGCGKDCYTLLYQGNHVEQEDTFASLMAKTFETSLATFIARR